MLVSVHCGSTSKHRAGNDKWAPLRPLPQPETIKVLLGKAGKCLSMESVVYNSCSLFSKRLLQQCGEDVRSAESIIGCLEAKVIDTKERMHMCMTRGDKTLIVPGCGKGLRGARLPLLARCLFLLPCSADSLPHRQYE